MPMELAFFTKEVERLGTYPALVLLPAFPFDHRMWRSVGQRLEGIPVVAVDPPGFGQSPPTTKSPSLNFYADMVVDYLRQMGVGKAVFVGNSMGGYTAMAIAEAYPKLVAGLGLIGTHAQADTEEAKSRRTEQAIAAIVGRAQYEISEGVDKLLSPDTLITHPQLLSLLRKWVMQAPGDGIAWAARAMAGRPNRLEVLRSLDVPALVVRGEDDTASTPSQAQEMARALGQQVVSLSRVGHLVPVEAPAQLSRLLLDFYRNC